MAAIEKRERKTGTTYRAIIRIKGFPPQQKTFKRLTDAKMWAQQTEAAIRRGELQAVAKITANKTLADAIDRYRNEIMPRKTIGTQRSEKSHLAYWEAALGEYGLTYIEPEMISRKLAALAKEKRMKKGDKPGNPSGGVRSLRTIKYYQDTLFAVFKYARQWQWTRQNPVGEIEKITKLRNERVRFLSDEERAALLKACKASVNKHLYPIVIFALSTGARKGEILGLTLEDLDLKRDMAVLRNTKNGDTRSVPVVHHLKELMTRQVKAINKLYDGLELPKHGRLLFARSDGKAPIELNRAWYNALERANLKDFRFHDLRHSTASYLAMNGASQLEIAAVLGHKTLQMVKRYAHLSENHTRDVVTKMNEKIF